MCTLPSAMEQWLDHLKTHRRYSPHTLSGYRHDLETLMALIAGTPLQGLSESHIRSLARALSA